MTSNKKENKLNKSKTKSNKSSKKVDLKANKASQKSIDPKINKAKDKAKKPKKKPINSELNTPLDQRTSYTKFSIKNTDNLINRARIKSIKKPSLKPELKTTKNLVIAVFSTIVLILIGQFIYNNYVNPAPTNYVYSPNKFTSANDSRANVDNNIFTRDVLILQPNESRTSSPIKIDDEGVYKACVMLKASDNTKLEIRIHTVGTWQKLKVGTDWLDDTIDVQKKWRLTSFCSSKQFHIEKDSEPIVTIKSDKQVKIANIKLEKTDTK